MDERTELILGRCFYYACVTLVKVLKFMAVSVAIHLFLRWTGWAFYPFF